MKALVASLVASAVLGQGHLASAQELRVDRRLDVTLTLAGAVALAGSKVYKDSQPPLPCIWCDRDAAGHDTLNAVDRSMRRPRWAHPRTAGMLGDAACFVVTPLAAGGLDAAAAAHDSRGRGTGVDALVIVEAAIVAANINEVVKLVVRRERPAVHALRSEEPPQGEAKSTREASVEDDLSFYSGHTTGAVSLAVAAGRWRRFEATG